MVITLRGPMELPGTVLPAGTYVLKLADSDPDRSLVQVFSKNGKRLYSTFRASRFPEQQRSRSAAQNF
jgi:hypothetical protein